MVIWLSFHLILHKQSCQSGNISCDNSCIQCWSASCFSESEMTHQQSMFVFTRCLYWFIGPYSWNNSIANQFIIITVTWQSVSQSINKIKKSACILRIRPFLTIYCWVAKVCQIGAIFLTINLPMGCQGLSCLRHSSFEIYYTLYK